MLRLRLLIALAVAAGLAIPGLFLARQEGVQVLRNSFAEVNKNLEQLADVSAEGLRDPLWQVSPELGKTIALAVFRDDRIRLLRVMDPQHSTPFLEFSRPTHAGENIISRKRDIKYLDRSIGSIEITMSTELASRAARQAQIQILYRTLIGLLLSEFLIFFVMQSQLVKPIEYLKRMSSKLAARELDEPINLPRSDELGLLANSLEVTRISLAQAFGELEEKNREIRKYAENMEILVAERTGELEQSNKQLSGALDHLKRAQQELIEADRLASLGRMVAGIAHELNTPLGSGLTVVSTLIDHRETLRTLIEKGALKRAEFEEFFASVGEGLLIMQRNVQRAAEMVDKFRQVAVDQTSEQRRSFTLQDFIDEVQMTLSPRFKHTPIILHLEVEENLRLDSYPGPLGQVLTNLELNALIHAFDGMESGNIWVSAKGGNEGQLRLSVKDDGVGMTSDIREHIFDPFFTTRLGRGGSGLGLSIVYNIVTGILGGKVSAISAPQQGAEFIVEIPLKAPQRQEPPAML